MGASDVHAFFLEALTASIDGVATPGQERLVLAWQMSPTRRALADVEAQIRAAEDRRDGLVTDLAQWRQRFDELKVLGCDDAITALLEGA